MSVELSQRTLGRKKRTEQLAARIFRRALADARSDGQGGPAHFRSQAVLFGLGEASRDRMDLGNQLDGFDPDFVVFRRSKQQPGLSLSVDAPEEEYVPLEIVSSSSLQVGDPVMVVGTPYGLSGSMSTGFVSALGRTLSAETTGGYVIPNVIQTTAPLNPGNSGGPVLNYQGQVVGIATAIVEDSQGVGFAIPSNTILREIEDLINTGSYGDHPSLGASGTDMTYGIAEVMDANVTYGWLIAQVTSGGPADEAGLQGGTEQVIVGDERVVIGGDIIVAINGTRITGIDDLSAYLEEYTLPGQTIDLTIVRDNETIAASLELGSRPTTTSTT